MNRAAAKCLDHDRYNQQGMNGCHPWVCVYFQLWLLDNPSDEHFLLDFATQN
jgi:hypothetical protein